MSEKGFTVKLGARVDAYVRAMKEAEQATEGFASGSTKSIVTLGKQMSSVGKTMTTHVTLPLAGLAGVAVKMAGDFDSTFAQMVGLAGVAAHEVDGLKQAVLDLAGETAVAPAQLAEALYDAASAGLTTQQAMDAVRVAAKGSAAGMGSVKDIVGLVASATASYGASNMDAAKAVDILTGTIRAGRADPAELAGTLGRILPVANQLGVSFEEVGGTVAYLSNVFGDTNRTVTAVSGLLVKLVSPTQQGRQALQEMGTSVEELQAAIREDGLLGALDLLRERGFGGNQQALRSLFDDIEGYQGALALLNADTEVFQASMTETADSVGATGDAFSTVAETDAFKLKQAMVDVQTAFVEAGVVIMPIVAEAAGAFADLVGVFSDLPPLAQQITLGFLATAAATGPVLMGVGGMIDGYVKLRDVMIASNVTMLGAAGPVGAAAAGIGLLIAALVLLPDRAKAAERAIEAVRDRAEATQTAIADMRREMDSLGDPAAVVTGRLRELAGTSDLMRDAMSEADITFAQLADGLLGGVSSASQMETSLYNAALATGASADEAHEMTRQVSSLGYEAAAAASVLEQLNDVTDDNTTATHDAAAAQKILDAEAERLRLELEAQRQAWQALLEEVERAAHGALNYERSLIDLRNSTEDYNQRLSELEQQQADNTITQAEYQNGLRDLRLEEIATAEQAWKTAEAYASQSGAQEDSAEHAVLMAQKLEHLALQYPFLRDEIDTYIAALYLIPDVKETVVSLRWSVQDLVLSPTQRAALAGGNRSTGRGADIPEFDTGGIVPGPRGVKQLAIVHGGETVLPTHRAGFPGADLLHQVMPAPASTNAAAATAGMLQRLETLIRSMPEGNRVGVHIDQATFDDKVDVDAVFAVANFALAGSIG